MWQDLGVSLSSFSLFLVDEEKITYLCLFHLSKRNANSVRRKAPTIEPPRGKILVRTTEYICHCCCCLQQLCNFNASWQLLNAVPQEKSYARGFSWILVVADAAQKMCCTDKKRSSKLHLLGRNRWLPSTPKPLNAKNATPAMWMRGNAFICAFVGWGNRSTRVGRKRTCNLGNISHSGGNISVEGWTPWD